MGLQTFDQLAPNLNTVVINAGSGTADIQVSYNTPGFASLNTGIYVSSTDIIDHIVDLKIIVGGLAVLLGSANVPAGAGTGGTPNVEMLSAVFGVGFPGLAFQGNDGVMLAVEVAVTTGSLGVFSNAGLLI